MDIYSTIRVVGIHISSLQERGKKRKPNQTVYNAPNLQDFLRSKRLARVDWSRMGVRREEG